MTLAEALRAHTGCKHSLALSISGPSTIWLTHAYGTQAFLVAAGTDVERGSAIFHECARRIFGDGEGHADSDLAITDEEFAGFCRG